jgi:hypothetical protein
MSHEPLDFASFLDPSAAIADAPPGERYDAWRLRPLDADEFARLSRSAQLAYLAWLDLLAATSHNTVPQRFRLHPEQSTLAVWLDRAYVLAASDEKGREALVSLGCGLANVEIGARCFGLRAEITLDPRLAERARPLAAGEPRYVEAARVRLHPGAERLDHAWLHAILARKVVRAEYDERVALDPAVAERMREIVAGYPGLELHLITDGPTKMFLGKFQEAADTTAFNRDTFALELGAWMLENDDPSFLGMRGAEYGLSDPVTRRMREGLLRTQTLLPYEVAGMAKAGYLGMRSASAVAVIAAQEDSAALRVDAGRAYEELALFLSQRDLSTAVHAAIVEVDAANLSLRARLRTRWRPTMLFRIGRPLDEEARRRPHAVRPPLATLMVPAEIP